MKRLLLLPLVVTASSAAISAVDPATHRLCIEARDYAGCVKSQSSTKSTAINSTSETGERFEVIPETVYVLPCRKPRISDVNPSGLGASSIEDQMADSLLNMYRCDIQKKVRYRQIKIDLNGDKAPSQDLFATCIRPEPYHAKLQPIMETIFKSSKYIRLNRGVSVKDDIDRQICSKYASFSPYSPPKKVGW